MRKSAEEKQTATKRATYCTTIDSETLKQLKAYCQVKKISIARYTEQIISDKLNADVKKMTAEEKRFFNFLCK